MSTRTALITGASRGLGRALATALSGDGWRLVVDGRDAARLADPPAPPPPPDRAPPAPGDVAAPRHRAAPAAVVGPRLAPLVNNPSALGPSPLPPLAELDA